ncbi:MAG: right-handed parallel beta-helix repeat-containing protein [Candidatus Coatesbacteria bacterium]
MTRTCICLCLSTLTAMSAGAQPPAAHGGTLLAFDFDGPATWPQKPSAGAGTIDAAGGREGSGGLLLVVSAAKARGAWKAGLGSGPLALRNAETNRAKLTLAFDLSVSAAHPVKVRIESFDSRRRRTGGLEAPVYPAAPDFYQRYALDLATMEAVGGGSFSPTDPFVGFTFELDGAGGWAPATRHELRLDNVHYASPAFYVRPGGDDGLDGRTEKAALATPQKAVDAAQPGDIILLMEGTWPAGRSSVSFRRGGTPAAWITLKNYPGHQLLLLNESWNCIGIGNGSRASPSTGPAVAYIEVRGLHIRGNADVADRKYPEALNKPDGRTNGNGIGVEGRYERNAPHHLRFAGNLVEYNSGAGISCLESDWVAIENNVSRNNCWWMIYAGSGISILGASNFDATEGNYKHLVRNNITNGNRCFLKWEALDRVSDGNGIILDVNARTEDRPAGRYLGRTLVQGNLSFHNGGSGIHAYKADHVDIVNNTAWMNSASPELQYGQIFAGEADDVRIINNILVAPVANLRAGEKPEPVNGADRCTRVVYAHNLYLGGNQPPVMGEGDLVGDPLFVRPSADPATADFHLKEGSPASRAGLREPFGPILDLEGRPFRSDGPPDLGALQE